LDEALQPVWLPIENFYQQLQREIAAGYIQQPEEAWVQESANK